MKLSSRIKCLVYSLYTYLIILTICACIMLVLGIFVLYHNLLYQVIVQNNLWIPSAALCLVAFVELLISYFGWRSIVRRHNCLITLFCVSIVMLIVVQLLLAGYVLVLRRDIHLQSRNNAYKSFIEYMDSGQISDQNHVWNRLQADMHCCGANGILDFIDVSIPWSCYNRPTNVAVGPPKVLYERGCLNALEEESKQRLIYIVVATVSSSFIQVYGIFCTIHLMHLLKASKKANINSNLERATPSDRNIELMPFAVPSSSTSTGSRPKAQMNHDSLQKELKRATHERMSRRQNMSHK